jgi:NADPH-dependent curcumin reductase CurA
MWAASIATPLLRPPGEARTAARERLDQTLDALLGFFTGENTGKMLVKLQV